MQVEDKKSSAKRTMRETRSTSSRVIWFVTALVMIVSLMFSNLSAFTQITAKAENSVGTVNISNLVTYVNGIELEEDADASQATVKNGDSISISFDWSITNNITDQSNRVLTYSTSLDPSGILLTDSGDVVDSYDGETVGTYTLENNVFTIVLDEDATKGKSNIGGGAIIEGTINLDTDDTMDDNSEQSIGVLDKNYKVIYNSNSNAGSISLKKITTGSIEYLNGVYTQVYTITATVKGKVTDITITDVVPDGMEFVDGSIILSSTDASGNYDNGTITVTLPNGATKNGSSTYTIRYTLSFTDAAIEAGEGIENTATANYKDATGAEQTTTASTTATPPAGVGTVTADKSSVGNIGYHDADTEDPDEYFYQDYEVTVTSNGACTSITLSDDLPDELTLISSSVEVDSTDAEITTADDNKLVISLPDGEKGQVYTYTITFRTKVSDDVVINLESVDNTAVVTYANPDGDIESASDTVTIAPISPSVFKSGSYAGISAFSSSFIAFDWTVTVDFGTLGLSLSDDEARVLLDNNNITDTIYYNQDESNTINPTPYGALTTDLDWATIALYLDASNQYNVADYFTLNSDGSYTLSYATSYYSGTISSNNITSITNVFEININGNPYSADDTVYFGIDDFSVNKTSSLDPNDYSNYYRNVGFTNDYVTVNEEKSGSIAYDSTNDYYYQEYKITVVTPENIPTSYVTVSIDLDDRLNYISGSASGNARTKNNSRSLNVSTGLSSSSSKYNLSYSGCSITLQGDNWASADYSSFDIILFSQLDTTYTITYRAQILDYDAGNDYTDLTNLISLDYDLEVPYSLSLDMSEIVSSMGNYTSSTLTFTDTIDKTVYNGGCAYYVDWDQDEEMTMTLSNAYMYLIAPVSPYTDSKYDDLREFLRNFEIELIDSTGTTYARYSMANKGNDYFNYIWQYFGNSTLTISRYSWSLTFDTSSANSYIWSPHFSGALSTLRINYNAIQYVGNMPVRNKGEVTIVRGNTERTEEDYVFLSSSNSLSTNANKSCSDSITLTDDTFEYGYDNYLGWLLYYHQLLALNKGDQLTITDYLPENVSYVDDSAIILLCDYIGFGSGKYIFLEQCGTADIQYDQSTRKITFTIDITGNTNNYSCLYIYFQSETEQSYFNEITSSVGKTTLTNTATFVKNGTTLTATASKTYNNTVTNPITKTANNLDVDWETATTSEVNAAVDYTISVNPGEQEINTGSDTVTVTDQLPEGFILDEDSVKASNGIDGSDVTITTDYDTTDNQITFTVPDNTYVVIDYTVNISKAYFDGSTYWYENSTNIATIVEGAYGGKTSSASISSFTYSTSRRVWAYKTEGDITLFKYWNNNGTMTALGGAEFTLYSVYDNNGTTYTPDTYGYKVAEVAIDDDGSVEIEDLALDRIYRLVETKAPDGYLTGEDYYFVLTGNNNIVVPTELTVYEEDGSSNVVSTADIESFSGLNDDVTIQYENYKYLDISLNKKWDGDEAVLENARPDTIEVALSRTTIVNTTPEDLGAYTVKADDDWTYTIEKLRAYDDDGNAYVYSIEEEKVDRYTSSVEYEESEDNDGTVTKVDFTITNTLNTADAITLTKRIKVEEIDGSICYEQGTPTFILELTDTDDDITYRHSYEFTEDYVNANKFEENGVEYVEISYTWVDLPAANYTATETNTSRYTLDDIINISSTGTKVEQAKTDNNVNTRYSVEFDAEKGTDNYATFYNIKNTYENLSDNSIVVNDII